MRTCPPSRCIPIRFRSPSSADRPENFSRRLLAVQPGAGCGLQKHTAGLPASPAFGGLRGAWLFHASLPVSADASAQTATGSGSDGGAPGSGYSERTGGIGHGGDLDGYHTWAMHFPDARTSIVTIVDSDTENAYEMTHALLDALFAPPA